MHVGVAGPRRSRDEAAADGNAQTSRSASSNRRTVSFGMPTLPRPHERPRTVFPINRPPARHQQTHCACASLWRADLRVQPDALARNRRLRLSCETGDDVRRKGMFQQRVGVVGCRRVPLGSRRAGRDLANQRRGPWTSGARARCLSLRVLDTVDADGAGGYRWLFLEVAVQAEAHSWISRAVPGCASLSQWILSCGPPSPPPSSPLPSPRPTSNRSDPSVRTSDACRLSMRQPAYEPPRDRDGLLSDTVEMTVPGMGSQSREPHA